MFFLSWSPSQRTSLSWFAVAEPNIQVAVMARDFSSDNSPIESRADGVPPLEGLERLSGGSGINVIEQFNLPSWPRGRLHPSLLGS